MNPEILLVLLCYVNGNASESTRLGDTDAIKISVRIQRSILNAHTLYKPRFERIRIL